MHDRVLEVLEQCRYVVLTDGDDLDQVYRLRYDCYRAEKSIPANQRRIMSDRFDTTPNCVHVAIEMDGALVSAVRLHLVSKLMLRSPTLEVFPEFLDSPDFGNTLLDPTRFVVHPDARKTRSPLHLLTLRIPFLATMFYDVETALAPVRAEHAAFYVQFLEYDHWADPRPYPGLRKPVALLTAKVKEHRDAVLAKYPFFGHVDSIPQSEIDFPDLKGVYAPGESSVPIVA
ncbi:MAG TPA: GNAT family N-acetyltransferase [Rhodobacteraceae bacterium]|nr:GNAT family N-acetyltransferase [Paracoccaceae bacterium]